MRDIKAGKNIMMGAFFSILLILAGSLHFQFFNRPLDRSEGEAAYTALEMLRGAKPYRDFYNVYLPGVYGIYAAFLLLFGKTAAGLRIGFMLIFLLNLFILFCIGRRLWNIRAGFFSALFYAAFSLVFASQGFTDPSSRLSLLSMLTGTFFLLKQDKKEPSLFLSALSGMSFGAALLFGVSGWAYIAAGFICTFLMQGQQPKGRTLKLAAAFLCGSAAAPFCLFLVLKRAAVWDSFHSWALEHASILWASRYEEFWTSALSSLKKMPLLIFFSLLGILSAFQRSFPFRHFSLIVLFLLASLANLFFALPGHARAGMDLIALLCVLAALAVELGGGRLFKRNFLNIALAWGISLSLVGVSVWEHQETFAIGGEGLKAPAALKRRGSLEAAREVGSYLKQKMQEEQKVAVLGTEPQIYFYAGARAASGYLGVLPLNGRHIQTEERQQRMAEELDETKPDYLVFVNSEESWGSQVSQEFPLIQWYLAQTPFYRSEMFVEWDVNGAITVRDGKDGTYESRSEQWIAVYQKDAGKGHSPLKETLTDLGRLSHEVQILQEKLARQPGNQKFLRQLADNQMALGRNEDALASYRKALAGMPEDAHLLFLLGTASLGTGNAEQANEYFLNALKADPRYKEAHYEIAMIHLRKCRIGEAVMHLEKELAIDFESEKAQAALGRIQLMKGDSIEEKEESCRIFELLDTLGQLQSLPPDVPAEMEDYVKLNKYRKIRRVRKIY